jgi:trehalose utilization protein
MMNRRELLGTAAVTAGAALIAGKAAEAQAKDLRVLCWSEHTEPKGVYPNGIPGAVAEYLNKQPGIKARTAFLEDTDQGISDETLDNIDVLTWWGHQKHALVRDDRVDAILMRMRERGLGVFAMHSSHYSKLLKRALNTSGDLGGVGNGGQETVYVVNPAHPVAKGVTDFALPIEEYYDEPFGIPEPHHLVFFSVFTEGGTPEGRLRRFRSGAGWEVGKGRLFYFRPGHEEYPTYFHPMVQTIIGNVVNWLGHRPT